MTAAVGTLTVLQRIEAGAARLDQVESGDWRQHIERDRLDIASEDDCLLGQLYGDWTDGLGELGIARDDAWRFGFEAATPTGDDRTGDLAAIKLDCRALNEGWRLYLDSTT